MSNMQEAKKRNIPYTTYVNRKKRGRNPEESYAQNNPCSDHEGNEFDSFQAMCAYWHQNVATVKQRLKKYELEDALTMESQKRPRKIKYDGCWFDGVAELLDYVGVPQSTYYWRKAKGLSFEDCIKPRNEKKFDG